MNMARARVPSVGVRGWIAVGAAAAIVVILANDHFVLAPDSRKRAAIRSTAEADVRQNLQLQASIAQLRLRGKSVADKSTELAAIALAIPPDPEEDELTDTIGQFAAKAHVSILKFAPAVPSADTATKTATSTPTGPGAGSSSSMPTEPAAYQSIPIAISADGAYPEVFNFIKDLETSPRLFVIDSVALTPASPLTGLAQPGGSVTVELTGEVFYTETSLASMPGDVSVLGSSLPAAR